MPTYEHYVSCCDKEFEDFYSIKADPPTKCPFCQTEGTVTRLISGGNGRGSVELYGHELRAKLQEDGQKLKKEVYSSEKAYANFLGEDKYQSIQTRMDRSKADRPKIKYR